MTIEDTLLSWREDDAAGLVGCVADGSVSLFTVSWSTAIDEIESGQALVVRTSLPGFERQIWKAGTFDDAKSLAERVLLGWHERVFGPLES